jgi:MFS family permease
MEASGSTARPVLDRGQLRTLALAALGGALEYYDFIIFVFLAVPIGRIFFPPETPDWLRLLQTWGLFAAGYLARPLGGVIMAHFGDRTGRRRMFMLSVLLLSVPTLLLGMLLSSTGVGSAGPFALLLLAPAARARRSAAKFPARGHSSPSTCPSGASPSPAARSPPA